MDLIKQFLPLFLTLSLGALVLSVGLNATRDDVLYVLRRPAELLKAVFAVSVIPPLVAGLLISVLPLAPVVKVGVMLMAISPVPPFVPVLELKVGGRKEYAYGIYAAMALLSIVTVPIVLTIASQAFGRDDQITFAAMVRTVAVGVLIPLLIGIAINRFAPAFAARAAPLIYKLSMVLVVLAFLPILIAIWPDLVKLVGNGTLLAMAAVVIISLACGHLLGGPERADRATLAIASAVRHPGIAMMIANSDFHDHRVTAAVLMFMLVQFAFMIPYRIWLKRSAPPTKLPA